MRGKTWRKYQRYRPLNGCQVGIENSSTAMRPPGRHTRIISRKPRSVSRHVAQSKGHRHDLKSILRERQLLGVGFDERDVRRPWHGRPCCGR